VSCIVAILSQVTLGVAEVQEIVLRPERMMIEKLKMKITTKSLIDDAEVDMKCNRPQRIEDNFRLVSWQTSYILKLLVYEIQHQRELRNSLYDINSLSSGLIKSTNKILPKRCEM
jgi:hypothetical protein